MTGWEITPDQRKPHSGKGRQECICMEHFSTHKCKKEQQEEENSPPLVHSSILRQTAELGRFLLPRQTDRQTA